MNNLLIKDPQKMRLRQLQTGEVRFLKIPQKRPLKTKIRRVFINPGTTFSANEDHS